MLGTTLLQAISNGLRTELERGTARGAAWDREVYLVRKKISIFFWFKTTSFGRDGGSWEFGTSFGWYPG